MGTSYTREVKKTVKICMNAIIYCDECSKSFDLEIPLQVLPVALDSEIEMSFPRVVKAPQGWKVQHPMVLCPEHNPEADEEVLVEKEIPSEEILEKARRLQALAMDKAAADNERSNAWGQFGKLWDKYKLPSDFGLEE